MSNEPEGKDWTAKHKSELVKDVIKGKNSRQNLRSNPSEIERWLDNSLNRMENA